VHVEVQAFLTLPDLTAEGTELDDHCQVIKPFSIETAVDHCVEPTSTGNYRWGPTNSHTNQVVSVCCLACQGAPIPFGSCHHVIKDDRGFLWLVLEACCMHVGCTCNTCSIRTCFGRPDILTVDCHCRRVVQVHLSTSDVDIELSQYVKRELHSLHNYLLTSFTSQDIADFSKHFAKVSCPANSVMLACCPVRAGPTSALLHSDLHYALYQ